MVTAHVRPEIGKYIYRENIIKERVKERGGEKELQRDRERERQTE